MAQIYVDLNRSDNGDGSSNNPMSLQQMDAHYQVGIDRASNWDEVRMIGTRIADGSNPLTIEQFQDMVSTLANELKSRESEEYHILSSKYLKKPLDNFGIGKDNVSKKSLSKDELIQKRLDAIE